MGTACQMAVMTRNRRISRRETATMVMMAVTSRQISRATNQAAPVLMNLVRVVTARAMVAS